jgi:hypothetical protein
MCWNCWDASHNCSVCGQHLASDNEDHAHKLCPKSKERKKTVKIEDFIGEDWFQFLPPSLQEEAIDSINSKIPEGGSYDPDHNCLDNIDCCDAYRKAESEGCTKLSALHDSDSCDHSDCVSQDTLSEQLEELKEHIKRFIDKQ